MRSVEFYNSIPLSTDIVSLARNVRKVPHLRTFRSQMPPFAGPARSSLLKLRLVSDIEHDDRVSHKLSLTPPPAPVYPASLSLHSPSAGS
jgi:hypothetical protein